MIYIFVKTKSLNLDKYMSIPLSAFEHKKGIFISFDSICLIFLTVSVFLLAYLEQTGNFDFDHWFILILAIWFKEIV